MPKHSKRAIEKLSELAFYLNDDEANDADSVAYLHTVLCQIGLPRTSTRARVWDRANGRAGLRVEAGAIWRGDDWVEQPLPYGPYARLILADISAYAVRHRTTSIPMESSVSAYMRRRLNLFPGGGKRGTYTSFKRQAQALTAARMSLGFAHGDEITNHLHAAPIESFRAWSVDDGPQQALWPCELKLSDSFLASLRAHAVLIDMRAYRALAHSALAQDIYTWLVQRLPRLKKPLSLPWTTLARQFGGYADAQRFRKEFLKRLKEVRVAYPDAGLEVVRGRRGEAGGTLRLKPSPPAVQRPGAVLPGSLGGRLELGER